MLDPNAIEKLKDWGGPDLVRQMVRLFLENSHDRMNQIRSGLSDGSLAQAERGAHSIKSSAGNLGAVRLQELAARMEELTENEDVTAAQALLADLEAEHENALRALQDLERGLP